MSNVLMDISLYADTTQSCRSIEILVYTKLSTPQNLPYLKQSLGEISGEDCHIVQEMCESRGGRPGLSVLTSLLVSADVKNY